MRGKVGEAHEYSYIVLNWLKRRGVVKKEEEVNERKWKEEEEQ